MCWRNPILYILWHFNVRIFFFQNNYASYEPFALAYLGFHFYISVLSVHLSADPGAFSLPGRGGHSRECLELLWGCLLQPLQWEGSWQPGDQLVLPLCHYSQ